MPKGLDITGENLEGLLACDDLFLDYFNNFLALPVFPQALVYNRLTGAFDEVEGLHTELWNSTLPAISPSLQYGPTDVERERMLEWAKEERLPLFLRTQLFRELKLVKLLLRALEFDRQSASRGSGRSIRGYSRSTESCISSLRVTADNSCPDIYDYDDIWGELNYTALYRHQRPGSRALSLPTKVLFDTQSHGMPSTIGSVTTRSERSTIEGVSPNISRRFDVPSVQFAEFPEKPQAANAEHDPLPPLSRKTIETARQKARISNKVEVIPPLGGTAVKSMRSKSNSSIKSKAPPSSTEEAFLRGARVLSAPANYKQFLNMPRLDLHEFETLFVEPEPDPGGQSYVQFGEEAVSEEQTETDMRNLEGKLKITIQQVKEKMLGTRGGFESFREFLQDTMGEDLLAFWLDCENYKDTMEHFDDIENMEIRNQHFRDIQDKYKLKLTTEARGQIMKAASNMGLSHTIFLRTQYDVLRRLRAYWIARFLIHCERMDTFSLDCEDSYMMEANAALLNPTRAVMDTASIKQSRPQNALFPCISLVHSMPMLPEDARDYANHLFMNVTFENDNSSARRMFPRQRSTFSAISRSSIASKISTTKERFVLALTADRLAGGPFQRYLACLDDPSLLASLLFWEDVTEFGSTEDHSSDRLLRLQHAWNIYNRYLSEDSPHRINLPEKEREHLQHRLEKAHHVMGASIFESSKIHIVKKLEKAWIRYLKEDLKCFLDCCVTPEGESPPSTAEAIEITVTEYDVVIKRPRPWVRRVLGSSSALRVVDDVEYETKALRKADALARRKEMERERKKAVRAAYVRQRNDRKKKHSIGSSKGRLDDDHLERDQTGDRSGNVLTYADMSANKQIMSMFRQYVTEGENKEILNLIQFYNEVENYFSSKDSKAKKDSHATHIAKMYLVPHGKKHTPLNDNIITQLAQEKDRPRTAVLREIQLSILPKIEEIFKDFITKQAEAFHMDPRDLPTMSQSEFAMRMSNDQSIMSGWNKRKSHGKLHDVSMPANQSATLGPMTDMSTSTTVVPGRPQSIHSTGSFSRMSLMTSRRGRRKTTGRAQATRDDKNEFLSALSQSAMGHLSVQMLYFYKYLLKHGEEDGMPLIDKDLFFYIEVQKFKDGSHAFSDDEMLRGKVQSIVECFFDSIYTPTLQIDIPSDMHQRTLRTSQRYLNGKEILPTLFDDVQFHVFKELLFYWAGYKRATGTPEDMNKRPVTKYDEMLQRRMENIVNYQVPSEDFILPSIPHGAIPSFSFSLSDGVKFKDANESFTGTPIHEGGVNKEHRGSKVAVTGEELVKRSRGRSGSNSVLAR